jgi:type IV pilus assembly protein PilF
MHDKDVSMRFFRFLLLLGYLFNASCAYQVVSPDLPPMPVAKRLSLIQAHLLLGQASLAKKQIDQIAEPDQGRDYWRLVSLYRLGLDDYDESVLVHQNALKKYPTDDFVLNNYGVLLGQRQLWKRACEVFVKANENGVSKRQSVQINLSRCALRQNDVNLAAVYLKQAKEIAELPLIGLMTELNLVLIQGNNSEAHIILNNIQSGGKITSGSVHFDEYNCLSWQLNARETDPTQYSSTSIFTCLNGSRY